MSKKQPKKKKKPEAIADPEKLARDAVDDPKSHKTIEEQLDELTPEQAEMFVRALELAMRKRRWMMIGYLGALIAVVVGMMVSLYIWGTREPGTFVGWVFLLPPALAGAVIWGTGKYVKKLGTKG